jgi:dipeptidyl-peptidase-4
MTVLRFASCLLTSLLLPWCAVAQGRPPLSLDTVLQRGASLQPALPAVRWLPAGHEATFLVTAADGSQALYRLADGKWVEPPLVTAAAVYAALELPVPKPARLPECRWLSPDRLRLQTDLAVFHWQLGETKAQRVLSWNLPDRDGGPLLAIAPDDQHALYVHQAQVWLADRSGQQRQLTADGSQDIVYGKAAHRAEFGIDRGLFWAADSAFFAFSREDQRRIDPYPYQDLRQQPPVPREGRYPMAGRTHARVQIAVGRSSDVAIHWLATDPDADTYLTNLTFGPDQTVLLAQVSRRQEDLELVRYDATSGRKLATLLQEHDPRWIEPEHAPTFLPDGRFLWWSSRSGYRHLWLHAADGSEARQVTQGAFDVQELVGFAKDHRTVYFAASGEDPRQRHLFAVALDGEQPEIRQLTRERGSHRCSLSPDGSVAFDTWSNLETMPQTQLLDLGQGTAQTLPAPLQPLAEFELPTQRLFQLNADESTVLYGHLALPAQLAEGQRLPVLLYVYGGPHVQLVTDQFLGGAPLWLQALVAEGYAVCRLDNRGSPHRGKAFEQAIHRQLGTLEVEDQLRAVAWLQQQPFVDPQRIGVHGWSYGGYLTLRLLLQAPTTFACGISGAPVTDWALYETGYGERYMDLPAENPAGYAASSCLPLAGKLQRPLLLVHGTDDRTVVWAHSLAFVDRCVDAGVQLDYFPYPMQQHSLDAKARQHFLRMLRDWLGKHLQPATK